MVGPFGIRGDGDCDADDAEEHEDQRPPGEVGEAAAEGGYYARDKGDDPGELPLGQYSAAAATSVQTHDADRNGRQREGVADDAADAERGGTRAAVAVAVS